jgi:hypothetical protein
MCPNLASSGHRLASGIVRTDAKSAALVRRSCSPYGVGGRGDTLKVGNAGIHLRRAVICSRWPLLLPIQLSVVQRVGFIDSVVPSERGLGK